MKCKLGLSVQSFFFFSYISGVIILAIFLLLLCKIKIFSEVSSHNSMLNSANLVNSSVHTFMFLKADAQSNHKLIHLFIRKHQILSTSHGLNLAFVVTVRCLEGPTLSPRHQLLYFCSNLKVVGSGLIYTQVAFFTPPTDG